MTVSATTPSGRKRFTAIETARGVAASLVALHHASHFVAEPRYSGIFIFGGLFNEFHVGVDFFFVLSGFLIAWVHWKDLGRRERIGRYALRRVTRIYPVYWAVLIPLLLIRLFLAARGSGAHLSRLDVVVSLFLVPAPVGPILGVAWTLVYEMFFYFVFGLLILIGPKTVWLLVFWAAATLGYSAFLYSGAFPASFFFSPYNLEFLFGIVAAHLLRRGRIPFPGWVAALGAGLFLGFMLGRVGALVFSSELAMRLVFGIPAMIFILGIVELERQGRITVPISLERFGAASYSIYLVHILIEPAALSVLWRHVSSMPPELIVFGLAFLGIVGGVIFHLTIERPLTKLIRHAVTPRGAVPA